MRYEITDFHGADQLCAGKFKMEWSEIEAVLTSMPTHLQGSQQNRKQGKLIFDPKGTNKFIMSKLQAAGWQQADIPHALAFFGSDVDCSKSGVIVEAQFSNYPFLPNNVMRTELFVRNAVQLPLHPTAMLVVVTKSCVFPASNSTLYYEQGQKQLAALSAENLFTIPVRLVGLTVDCGSSQATFTVYKGRTSRTVVSCCSINCDVTKGKSSGTSMIVKVDDPPS